MNKRTKINITSNTQFPPLQQQVTKDIYNNSQDEASEEDESFTNLAHKKRSDYDSEINKEKSQQQKKKYNTRFKHKT